MHSKWLYIQRIKNQQGIILISVLIFISIITSLLIFQLHDCEMQAMMNANMRSSYKKAINSNADL